MHGAWRDVLESLTVDDRIAGEWGKTGRSRKREYDYGYATGYRVESNVLSVDVLVPGARGGGYWRRRRCSRRGRICLLVDGVVIAETRQLC